MALVRLVRVGLFLPLLSFALCAACGGDDDEEEAPAEETSMGERPGPAGCYIIANMACDCDLEEAACTEMEGTTWVDMGCGTCQM